MKDNVINFNRETEALKSPDDLMSFKELEIKYGLKYGFLYKWACLKRELNLYERGCLKLSEKEVLDFLYKRTMKYGGNK